MRRGSFSSSLSVPTFRFLVNNTSELHLFSTCVYDEMHLFMKLMRVVGEPLCVCVCVCVSEGWPKEACERGEEADRRVN